MTGSDDDLAEFYEPIGPDGDADEDPCCPDCGCDLFTEFHDWDCGYDDEDDDDMDYFDDGSSHT